MSDPTPHLTIVDEHAPHCVHHWVLGDSIGGRILGRCRRCDASKVFPANPESTDRFDDYRELVATSSYYRGDQLSA